MSKIEFLPLGGINERGNNCYVLTVDNDIFVINTGIYIPTVIKLGINYMIPDYSFLVKNKERIKGIFIFNACNNDYGSLDQLIKKLSQEGQGFNIPIYAEDIAIEKLVIYLSNNNVEVENFIELKALTQYKISNITFTPFKVCSNTANSLGCIFKISDKENIIYIDDFIIANDKTLLFNNQLLQIFNLMNVTNATNILITGLGQIDSHLSYTAPNHHISSKFNNILDDLKGKLLIAVYEDDMYKYIEMISLAARKNIPMCITNADVSDLITFMIEKGYIKDKITFIQPNEIKNHKNVIIFLIFPPHLIFDEIVDCLEGKLEENLTEEKTDVSFFSEKDSFLFASKTINGFERQQADMYDEAAKYGLNVSNFSSVLPVSASNEDLKFIVSLIKPKYIIPISCLHMEMVKFSNLLQTVLPTAIILLNENGKVLTFNNFEYQKENSFIQLEPQYVGNKGKIDSSTSSLSERSTMQENGVVLVTILFNSAFNKIEKTQYTPIGVVNVDNKLQNQLGELNKEFTNKINMLLTSGEFDNDVNFKNLKLEIKKMVLNKYKKTFNKEPLIILSMVDIANKK
jgi:ribonuclease J